MNGPGSYERRVVGEMEEIVCSFISDTSRDILEFPAHLGAYPKMVAHRVAQAYGLMTSTVDYEDGPGRVVGTRTQHTFVRETRLVKMDLSQFVQPSTDPPVAASSAPRVLLRPNASDPNQSGIGVKKDPSLGGKGSMTLAEREEEYNRARERIIGTLELPQDPSTLSSEPVPAPEPSPPSQPSPSFAPQAQGSVSLEGAGGGGGGGPCSEIEVSL